MNTKAQMHQQDLQRLQLLRYMDDDFMTVCLADDVAGVQLILRIVLGREDITVESVRTQDIMKNLQGRSIVLDVHAVDSDKKEYDVEIQRTDAGAGAKRARYHSSLLDAHILKPGEDTEAMPESFVIFITENDIMQGDRPIYPVDRYVSVGEEKVRFPDGSHILYVNGRYRGDDEVGRLMHDFSCTNPDDMNYGELAQRARYFKQDEKGVAVMCKLLEDMRNEAAEAAAKEAAKEAAEKMAIRMIKAGKMSLEDIADYTELSPDRIKELADRSMQFV